jgi:hypothetical protein
MVTGGFMKLHATDNYKDYTILIYYTKGYYKSVICINNECESLISLHITCYEALTYAKRRIDVK